MWHGGSPCDKKSREDYIKVRLKLQGTPEGRQPGPRALLQGGRQVWAEWGCVLKVAGLKCEAVPAVGSQPISSQAPDAGQSAAGLGRFSLLEFICLFLVVPWFLILKYECLLCTISGSKYSTFFF